MSDATEGEIARQFTGLCTYLVQGPEFSAGDEVYLVCQREPDDAAREWYPVTAVVDEERESLTEGERLWGTEVILVRARLAATGGQPRDSVNVPADDYDPDALTLADVQVVDRVRH